MYNLSFYLSIWNPCILFCIIISEIYYYMRFCIFFKHMTKEFVTHHIYFTISVS